MYIVLYIVISFRYNKCVIGLHVNMEYTHYFDS